MSKDPTYWSTHPLTPQAISYASQDVLQLLTLADKQKAQLREGACQIASLLSQASSQLKWLEEDQTIRY